MNATLDGIVLFEQRQLNVKSWQRAILERSVPGLDGIVSIDLGVRRRKITQSGLFRSVSEREREKKIDSILLLMDGDVHTLTTQDGKRFDNLRIDSFEVKDNDFSGRGNCCEFEIDYTQLLNSLAWQ